MGPNKVFFEQGTVVLVGFEVFLDSFLFMPCFRILVKVVFEDEGLEKRVGVLTPPAPLRF